MCSLHFLLLLMFQGKREPAGSFESLLYRLSCGHSGESARQAGEIDGCFNANISHASTDRPSSRPLLKEVWADYGTLNLHPFEIASTLDIYGLLFAPMGTGTVTLSRLVSVEIQGFILDYVCGTLPSLDLR